MTNMLQGELDALIYMEGTGVVKAGQDIARTHAASLAEKGLVKDLGNGQYLCAAKGRHLISTYRQDKTAITIAAPKAKQIDIEEVIQEVKVKPKAKTKKKTVTKKSAKPAARKSK